MDELLKANLAMVENHNAGMDIKNQKPVVGDLL